MATADGARPLHGRVLVTWVGYDPDGPRTGARLRAAGLDVVCAPKVGARTAAQVAELASGAVAAIVSTDPFDRSVFAAARELRVVARVGVGTDSIDLGAAAAAGVLVTTTPGANSETAADHALAMILAAVRRIVEHDASVRRGEWRRGEALTPWDLHRTTVGLVGCGEIGRAVARRLRGFAVEVLACDPASEPGDGIERVTLPALLARADVVSLHLPLTAATRGLIGAEQLAGLRPTAVLVNTSRGGLVDERALVKALERGRLRAAALDVFADEPAVPAALTRLANVVLTPHIGGLSERSLGEMTEQATGHVLAALAGRPDPAVVANPALLAAGAVSR
jgi:phosphoglycerate dehydrogenase-like enzyme